MEQSNPNQQPQVHQSLDNQVMNHSQPSSMPLPYDGGGGAEGGTSDGNNGNNGSHGTATGGVSGEGGSHKERRASIQAIMKDQKLTPQQRRRSIQFMMDGRRRSSSCMMVSDGSATTTTTTTPLGLGASTTTDATSSTLSTTSGPLMASSMMDAAATVAAEFAELDSSDSDKEMDTIPTRNNLMNNRHLNSSGQQQQQQPTTATKSTTTPMETKDKIITITNSSGISTNISSSLIGYDSNGNSTGNTRQMEMCRPVCTHYERNCTFITPCCGQAFGCRLCHDECEQLLPPFVRHASDSNTSVDTPTSTTSRNNTQNISTRPTNCTIASTPSTNNESTISHAPSSTIAGSHPFTSNTSITPDDDTDEFDNQHKIDRFALREIICRNCFTRQDSKSNKCIKCNVTFGEYHCSKCNLWMSNKEQPYHCDGCGFCRLGGRDEYKHCYKCGMCVDIDTFDTHDCRPSKYKTRCPVCYEDLWSSRTACHEMPCGHIIHWECFEKLSSYDCRCPICKKCFIPKEHLDQIWRARVEEIQLQPLTPDLCKVVDITCNDCEVKSVNQAWHFLGVQCRTCGGFNTVVGDTKLAGLEAFQFLTHQRQRNQHQALVAHAATDLGEITRDVDTGMDISMSASGTTSGISSSMSMMNDNREAGARHQTDTPMDSDEETNS